MTETCPTCGAPLPESGSCRDHFYQLLYWENEDPALGAVHHLTVLCYYLQHPEQYSPEGLAEGLRLLERFLAGASPGEARAAARGRADSGARGWTVTARPGQRGSYAHPVRWTVTAADVAAAGKAAYLERVPAWARAVYQDLLTSGNLK